MHELALIAALLLVAMAQTTLVPRPLQVAPNLMLLLVICRSVVAGLPSASRWAFYGGLSLDVCAGSMLGSHALALLVAVVCAGLPLARLHRDNWLLPLVGALLGTLGYHLVLAALTMLLVAPISVRAYALAAVPDLITTLVPALPLFLAMRWYARWRRGEVPVDVY